MRILFASTAGTGHFEPLLPVARACAEAGHEVRVAAPQSFASHVERAGFPHEPFDDVPPHILGPIFGSLGALTHEEANARVVREVFAGHDAHHALPGVQATIDRWRPDLVVREPCEFGSLAAAVAAGVPRVEVAIGVLGFLDLVVGLVDEPLLALDAAAGLAPGTLLDAMLTAPVATTVPAALDGPSSTDRAVWRFRDAAATPAQGSLPEAWGDPALPLVYATYGSVAGAFSEFAPVFQGTLDALTESPVRLLLTTGHAFDPTQLGPVPANALVRQWWPQAEAMPQAAAIIGHGGFGTTMAAVVAGVPQVMLPLFSSDQFVNAERIASSGAGLVVEGGPSGVAGLPAAVDKVLDDPRYLAAAQALAAEAAALPDAGSLVPLLEAHAAS